MIANNFYPTIPLCYFIDSLIQKVSAPGKLLSGDFSCKRTLLCFQDAFTNTNIINFQQTTNKHCKWSDRIVKLGKIHELLIQGGAELGQSPGQIATGSFNRTVNLHFFSSLARNLQFI